MTDKISFEHIRDLHTGADMLLKIRNDHNNTDDEIISATNSLCWALVDTLNEIQACTDQELRPIEPPLSS